MATTSPSTRAVGAGRVLVVVYAILALAATGRSAFQILSKFDTAPLAYALSAVAAVVYIVATVALIARGDGAYRAASAAIGFELAGVLVIGTLSVVDPQLFPDDTVWSQFGRGYLFIPLVLPIVGLGWLWKRRPSAGAA
jgi:hypothetical protein